MHHHFGSKFLIDCLNSMGFCSSYSEVIRFERSAAKFQGTDLPNITSNHFIQSVAENVDHNIVTLDGHNTFYGMGIIAAVTPMTKTPEETPPYISNSRECSSCWQNTNTVLQTIKHWGPTSEI